MTTTTTTTDEAVRLVEEMYASFEQGDTGPWLDRMSTAHEPLGIGTDPDEFWRGRELLTEVVSAQLAEMSSLGIRFEPGEVTADSRGDVAWVANEPTLTFPDGTAVPMRFTAVLVREGAELRWAQWHLSIGVANEEALDAELTTGA